MVYLKRLFPKRTISTFTKSELAIVLCSLTVYLLCVKKIEYQNVLYPIANCSQISSLFPKHTISSLIYFQNTLYPITHISFREHIIMLMKQNIS